MLFKLSGRNDRTVFNKLLVDFLHKLKYSAHTMAEEARKIIAQNKKAYFNYAVEEKIECGIALQGSEVKSLRDGKVSFPDSFALIENGEVWIQNCHISEYSYAANYGHDPDRKKKLLLHKAEIKRLQRKVSEKGFTLVPLQFYFKNGRVKVELGLCKGKKNFDKRADMKDRDVKLELNREFKDRQKW